MMIDICDLRKFHDGLMTVNEVRKLLGLEPIQDAVDYLEKHSVNHTTNCKNCGAPLSNSGKCEYCGTQY